MEEETMIKSIFLLGMMMSTPLVYAGGVDESEPFGSNTQSAKHDSTVTLQEVSVRANFANEQVTPLNLTTITSQSLRIHTTAPNYVEVMQCVQGVYATSTSGSYGDASLNIRGFKQDNVAIMLNAIFNPKPHFHCKHSNFCNQITHNSFITKILIRFFAAKNFKEKSFQNRLPAHW
ncbi:MAG: TonB-dependent receptor plug domain-containing protein [Sodaliphilus sp.]